MAGMARRIFDNIQRYYNGQNTKDNFMDILKSIAKISWEGGKDGVWGVYSNRGGIDKIVAALQDVIRENRSVKRDYTALSSLAGEEEEVEIVE